MIQTKGPQEEARRLDVIFSCVWNDGGNHFFGAFKSWKSLIFCLNWEALQCEWNPLEYHNNIHTNPCLHLRWRTPWCLCNIKTQWRLYPFASSNLGRGVNIWCIIDIYHLWFVLTDECLDPSGFCTSCIQSITDSPKFVVLSGWQAEDYISFLHTKPTCT